MSNAFQRTELLLGQLATERLKKSHIAIFGLGGVGSYAAEALARAGVGEFSLFDFDKVGESNINRQNIAFTDTVGQPKVNLMAERIARINPDAKINAKNIFYDEHNSEHILDANFSAVIDAIDSFNSKISLLSESHRLAIPVFSAMGAAGKIDPTQIRSGDISKSSICPMARKVRKFLRYKGIKKGIKVVYSLEAPVMPYSHTIFSSKQNEFEENNGMKKMIQGSISYLPAIFGLTLAGLVVQHLSGYESAKDTPPGQRTSGKDGVKVA